MGVGRHKKNVKTHMGFPADPSLATAFGNLAQTKGVSMREAMRRCVVKAVLEGEIPGIEEMGLEQRENAKYGPATPLYDKPEGQTKPVEAE